MKKLSFKKAAEKILEKANEPMTAKEITEIALEEDIIETYGATPAATLAAQLYSDINRNPSTKFKKVGKGLFALKKQTVSSKSPLLAIQNQNDLVRQKLAERIFDMDPFQFEYLIAELLKKIGYENVEVTNRTGDKGIDVMGNLTVGGLTHVKTVIQVKRYKTGNNISGRYITQLRGSAAVDQRGLIITTSDFTRSAVIESRAPNKMPVALVNGEKLIELLFQYKVGVKEDIVSVYSVDGELFEYELSDPVIKGDTKKSKAIWPMPGGIGSYVDTLNALLGHIRSTNSSKDDLIKWFQDSFESVTSDNAAAGYINVPRNMGLVEYIDGVYRLSESGEKYLESRDSDLLFQVISSNILAVEEICQFLQDEPKSEQEILEYVVENFDVDWTTLAQVKFRLLWLINLNKVEKTEEGFIGITGQ